MSLELRPGLTALSGYHSPQLDVRVRLNNNESPYPPPPAFVEELSRVVARIPFNRYPERTSAALRKALAAICDARPDEIFPANGSNEVLQTLLLAFGGPRRQALAFAPTYTLHAQISHMTGTPFVAVPRTDDLLAPPDVVRRALEEHSPDIVFFCHPNNPTGLPEDRESVRLAAEDGARLVIVDEAYAEFAGSSMLGTARTTGNVVVVRTLSKAWAVPACRIGYLVASGELVASLEAAELPYHVSALTQEAGATAVMFDSEMRERVAATVEERKRVTAAVGSSGQIEVWPSQANFFLMRPRVDADTLWRALLARGVLVRNFASRPDLPGCLRVTIGTADENDAFLDALAASLSELAGG